MSCEHCTMDVHKSGKMVWWQGAEYVDGEKHEYDADALIALLDGLEARDD